MTERKDVYRGNKEITVKELTDLLSTYAPEKIVHFHVDSNGDEYVSHCHVSGVEEFPGGEPWITLESI